MGIEEFESRLTAAGYESFSMPLSSPAPLENIPTWQDQIDGIGKMVKEIPNQLPRSYD